MLSTVNDVVLAALGIGPAVLMLTLAFFMFSNSSLMAPPSEYLCIFGGIYGAGQPIWYMGALVLALVMANLIGTTLWYGLGVYRSGRNRSFLNQNFVDALPRFVQLVYLKKLPELLKLFSKNGKYDLLVLRNVPFIRSIVSYPAGYVRMPLTVFLGYSFLGISIWVTAWSFLGYALGHLAFSLSLPIAMTIATVAVVLYSFFPMRS